MKLKRAESWWQHRYPWMIMTQHPLSFWVAAPSLLQAAQLLVICGHPPGLQPSQLAAEFFIILCTSVTSDASRKVANGIVLYGLFPLWPQYKNRCMCKYIYPLGLVKCFFGSRYIESCKSRFSHECRITVGVAHLATPESHDSQRYTFISSYSLRTWTPDHQL